MKNFEAFNLVKSQIKSTIRIKSVDLPNMKEILAVNTFLLNNNSEKYDWKELEDSKSS